MGRKGFKILCITSVVLFFLLILITIFAWLMVNVAGALLTTVMFHETAQAMPLAKFLENFVGSPMFYIFLADILAFAVSVIGLTAVKKPPKQHTTGAE